VAARRRDRHRLVDFVEAVEPAGLSATDIEDALWLARWIRDSTPADAPAPPEDDAGHPARAGERLPVFLRSFDPAEAAPPRDSRTGRWQTADPSPASVVSPDHLPVGEAATVRIPLAAGAQAGKFARFAHRLRSQPAADMTGPIDEAATAARAADTGIIWPVRARRQPRRATAKVVVDTSVSMVVWDGLERDLIAGLTASRSFRRMEVWSLALLGRSAVVHGRGGDTPPRVGTRRLLDLGDPTGNSVILILTDGVSQLWYTGAGFTAAQTLAARNPTAILQPLPNRLWRRTALAPRSALVGGMTAQFHGFHLVRDPRRDRAPAVPVLEAETAWLNAWAGLTTGRLASGRQALLGPPPKTVPFPASRTSPVSPTSPAPTSPGVQPVAGELAVRRFQTSASAGARELAAALSSIPLSLPVMQMVLDVCIQDPSPVFLAEVITGGLMHQSPASGDPAEPLAFRWLPGIREEFRRQVGERRATEVTAALSAYLDRELGFGPNSRGFRAVMGQPGPATSGRVATHPFAFVLPSTARRVLDRSPIPDTVLTPGEDAAVLARVTHALESTKTAHEGEQAEEVDAAIDDARVAVGAAGPDGAVQPRLTTSLAELLAERWRRTGSLDDLEEAIMVVREYGQTTPADGPDAARARGLLADLLLERFRATSSAEYLDDSIGVRRQAVEMLAPSEAGYQTSRLAQALLEHHRLSGSWLSLYEATDLANALTAATEDEDVRLRADVIVVQCLDLMSRASLLEEDLDAADRQWSELLDRGESLSAEDAVAVRGALEARVRFHSSSGRSNRARELATALDAVLARLGEGWGAPTA
jgi:hypothetical protein